MSEDQAPDPNSISMDDLEKLVNSTEPSISEDPLAELEPEAQEEVESEVQEGTGEEEAPAEEEAPKDEPKKDAEADGPEPVLPEHVKLRLEATELERKKFEALAGRHAGELGFLKERLRGLEERLNSRTERDDVSEQDDQPERKPKDDNIAEWASRQSLAQTVNGFTAQYPDADAMAVDIVDHLKSNGVDLNALATSHDPISVAQEARTLLELAYLHVSSAKKHEAAEKAEREFARRTVDESTKLAGRRKAVSATPSGGVRGAAPTRNQDPRTMPLKDLSRMIERLGSGTE